MNRLAAVLLVTTALPTPGLAQRVEVHEATITELQAAMTQGRVTAVQLVDAYLARIAAYEAQGPALNAMIRLNPNARAEAAALDDERRRGRSRGPLHGIPIILKDNFDTHDLPTTAGSIALAAAVPPDDGFVVRKLREAGAIILGKANMHELAAGITTISSLGGQTRNPYDPARCPGGSSGGTGAAIAASFAAVGWGSDTCGSIRIPAAFGSLFGLRPTQGLVSRDGIIPLSHTQDIAGPLARTAMDLAIALDATVGPDPADAATRVLQGRPVPRFVESLQPDALRGARLGVLSNYFAGTDDDVERVARAAIDSLRARGAEVVDVTIPELDSLLSGSRAVDFETKFDLLDYLAQDADAPVRSLSDMLAKGLYHVALESRFRRIDTVSARDSEPYRKALAKQAVVRDSILRLLDSLRLDALVYPTMRQPPALIGSSQGGSTCVLSAHTGFPALTMPVGYTPDGLPVGLELLGRPFADARLVSLAYAFEQAGPRRRAPSTTPPLVNGRAPQPVTFEVTARGSPATARATLVFDPLRNALAFEVRVTGVPRGRVQAVVLRRGGPVGPGAVVHRLLGPGVASGTGSVTLSGSDRQALVDGRVYLAVFTTDQPTQPAQAALVLPPPRP